jgi:hypothetical protein
LERADPAGAAVAAQGRLPGEPGGVGRQRRETLRPPVHRDVIDVDAAFGQQLRDIAV